MKNFKISAITEEERNELFKNITGLLRQYGHSYKDDAVHKIISEWESNKYELIQIFKEHPNYIEGKFMIGFDYDYDRKIDPSAANEFVKWVLNDKLYDWRDNISDDMKKQARWDCCSIPEKLYEFFNSLQSIHSQTISEGTASKLNDIDASLRASAGQKTSRAINKLCKLCGIDKLDDYNKEFAKYADSLNPIKVKRHTVISINPMDYLTMSFGNSWASCHTIDKSNVRHSENNYSGAYCSGTISYMLDKPSMVFYTVDKSYDGDEYYTQDKINRQMFHYADGKLVQGRLYPQTNDSGSESTYTTIREIVQKVIADCIEEPNIWVNKGYRAINDYCMSVGTHYRDYFNFSTCNLTVLKGQDDNSGFVIGAYPLSVYTGRPHSCEDDICVK